jgi:hypothetical protein
VIDLPGENGGVTIAPSVYHNDIIKSVHEPAKWVHSKMSSFVVCRLTECIAEAPLVTLRCMDCLVRGTVTNWGSKEWKIVETLLITALQQEQQDLHNLAKEIISYLAIHGHTDLLKFLP